jgi:hypothetical protein
MKTYFPVIVSLSLMMVGCSMQVSDKPTGAKPAPTPAPKVEAVPSPESDTATDIPGSTRYLPADLIPQRVRYYADDQPVLENPWISVPRAAGFGGQEEYLLAVYPSVKALPKSERAAALRGLKRSFPPILEKSADGLENPVYEEIKQVLASANLGKITDGDALARLYFHAQSPLREASPDVREKLLQQLLNLTFKGINPDAIAPEGEGNASMGGEYMVGKILLPYLMLEIFRPEALTMDQRRTLNRVLMHPFFGFNGQLGIVGITQELMSGILNKQVFIYNNLPVAASLMELQMARYPESENLWPGFARDLPNLFRDIIAEGYRNYHSGLMGDGATRYVPNYTHAYYYEGPQMDQMMRNYLNTYDESDPVMMQANKVLADRIVAIGNYYEQTSFRVVEADEDSHHQSSRAQMSEAKNFGNELVHRSSDPLIHWALANLTGNRWLRQSGPAVQAQRIFENPAIGFPPPGIDMALASAWNPKVRIGREASTGSGFRQDYLFWDRNNLGATGKFGNWAFHLIGRGLIGRRPNPAAAVSPLFEKDTFAGFVARNAGSPPTDDGLRTDHRLAHVAYVGIFPEKSRFWGSVKNTHPELSGIGPGYAPHWEAAKWSATVTDGFAVQASSARAEATDAVCRELWLATANCAVGLLSGDVSEDPKNGDGYARLSFLLHGFFGTRIRSYRKQDGFQADPITSPITFPTLTPDGNGFNFVNLRVRVLEQNFTSGSVFAHLKKPEDFYPTDKRSPEMRGLDERSIADNESHGAVTREVQARGRFTDGRRPTALVLVHTGDEKNPLTARRIPALPGVQGDHLVMQVKDGDTGYLIIFNPGDDLLDLSGWELPPEQRRSGALARPGQAGAPVLQDERIYNQSERVLPPERGSGAPARPGQAGAPVLQDERNGEVMVRVYRSGARYRPDFLGNIEVNPEADKENEIIHGAVIQNPPLQPMREAVRERIPPHGHLVLVSGGKEFKTGGPGFEVRPPFAEWRFRPENRDGNATRELTGRGPALTGGEQMEGDAVRVSASEAMTGDALAIPDAGTIRFWIKPESRPDNDPALLFASVGSSAFEVWLVGDVIVVHHADGGRMTAQRFEGGLDADAWQQVVVIYESTDPATWRLRVNDALRKPVSGGVDLPALEQGLRLGGRFAALFKDLAIHDAALTPGEINYLHDREQPRNFNRVRVTGIPANVWLNGNRLNEGGTTELVDTDKLTRHLKPGVNVIGIEMASSPRDPLKPGLEIWIRGRQLTSTDSPFLGGWQTLITSREGVGSRLLAAYDAQIKRQMEHLAAQGKDTKDYRNPDWRPHAYDRPWLARQDTLPWQPVSWAPSGMDGEERPELDPGEGLRLLRFTFAIDEQGVPRPFMP